MSASTPAESSLHRLADGVGAIAQQDLAPEVWDKAKACLLDSLGLARIARNEATTAAICASIDSDASPAGSLVWATGQRAPLSDAVAANGVAVHAHFHDDSDPHSWCHPGSLIAPVAVGAAERAQGSIELALRSLIAGYVTLNWLGAKEEVAHALIKRGIRTSPSLGTIGAAAAASVALGLDRQQTAHALAMAASITGGTLAPLRSGSDEWRLQNAHAGRGGLLAAQLAKRGVHGAAGALDGPKGLLLSLAGLEAAPARWQAAPRPEAILDIYAKPWATLGDNMAAVRAAKLLHGDGGDPAAIERIEVTIWRAYAEYPGTQYKGPFELPVQALASTSFAVAAMLMFGDLEYDVSLGQRQNPALLRLVERTTIVPSDEGTKLDSVVTLHMKDGSRRARPAAEAPRTWLYHDQPTAVAIFEGRLARSGRSPGAGRQIAERVFDALAGQRPVHTLLAEVVTE